MRGRRSGGREGGREGGGFFSAQLLMDYFGPTIDQRLCNFLIFATIFFANSFFAKNLALFQLSTVSALQSGANEWVVAHLGGPGRIVTQCQISARHIWRTADLRCEIIMIEIISSVHPPSNETAACATCATRSWSNNDKSRCRRAKIFLSDGVKIS